MENENLEEMELEDNIIVLTDDEGKETEFEFVDLIEMDDKEYVILLPMDDEESGEVVILKVETEGEEETYVSVDNEEEGNKVFELFKEKYKDEFEFED